MSVCGNRIHIALTAVTIALFTGIVDLRAEDQTAMFADADGLEPPDPGVAYAIPINLTATTQQYPLWPELVALLSDPDGMNAPGEAIAYAFPVTPEDRSVPPGSDSQGLVFDPDDIEPPDIGIAYEFETSTDIVAVRSTKARR